MKKIITFIAAGQTLLGAIVAAFADTAWVENFQTSEARQQTPEWCWAACTEMALKSGGVDISQASIVEAIKGRLVVEGASNPEIMRALNSCGFNQDGTVWKATAVSNHGAPIPAALIEQLKNNHPVIVSYRTGPMSSHVVIIHAAAYSPSYAGPIVNGVTIFDPYTGQDFQVSGAGVFAETQDSWYVSVHRSGSGTPTRRADSGSWEEIGADSPDIEIHSTPNWGDKSSGGVSVRVRIKNTSDDDTYKVEVKVAVVRKDRSSGDISGEINSGTQSTIVGPNSSKTITYNLRWATSEWQPNAAEMPAIASPESDTDYSRVRIWKKASKQEN